MMQSLGYRKCGLMIGASKSLSLLILVSFFISVLGSAGFSSVVNQTTNEGYRLGNYNSPSSLEGEPAKEVKMGCEDEGNGPFHYIFAYGIAIALLKPLGLYMVETFKPDVLTSILIIGPLDVVVSFCIGKFVGGPIGSFIDDMVFCKGKKPKFKLP